MWSTLQHTSAKQVIIPAHHVMLHRRAVCTCRERQEKDKRKTRFRAVLTHCHPSLSGTTNPGSNAEKWPIVMQFAVRSVAVVFVPFEQLLARHPPLHRRAIPCCRRNARLLLECFPYACPEPVLEKTIQFSAKLRKRCGFVPLRQGGGGAGVANRNPSGAETVGACPPVCCQCERAAASIARSCRASTPACDSTSLHLPCGPRHSFCECFPCVCPEPVLAQ